MTRTTLLLGGLLAIGLLAMGGAEAQQRFPSPFDTRGTPEDRRACSGDASKLCRAHLADDMAVLRCFKAHRSKLSSACEAVLRRYNQ